MYVSLKVGTDLVTYNLCTTPGHSVGGFYLPFAGIIVKRATLILRIHVNFDH